MAFPAPPGGRAAATFPCQGGNRNGRGGVVSRWREIDEARADARPAPERRRRSTVSDLLKGLFGGGDDAKDATKDAFGA